MWDDLKNWQAARHAELAGPESWLGIRGLFWLEPGLNSVGSADGSVVLMPGGPAHLGEGETALVDVVAFESGLEQVGLVGRREGAEDDPRALAGRTDRYAGREQPLRTLGDPRVAGQAVTLLPMAVSEKEVFFVFRDRTSGKETYGAGRFLKTPAAVDGKISLNFNCAYNPPCAFTPFATCPLPPPENWLPFPVAAGEMKVRSGND